MAAGFQREIPGFSVSCGARGFWAEVGHPMGHWCRDCLLGHGMSHDGCYL